MTTVRLLFSTIALVFGMVHGASAQALVLAPVPTTTVLEFTHNGVDTTGYAIWVDGARSQVAVTSAGTDTYRTAFPALTPGTHTIEFTAYVTVDGVQIDSAKSDPLVVRIVVVPAKPGIPRIVTVQQADGTSANAPRLVTIDFDETHHLRTRFVH